MIRVNVISKVERVVRTYGFIHNERAINYIRQHNVTTIRWKFRARFMTVGQT